MTPSSGSVLEEMLHVYWLRPETALWRSIDVDAMRGFDFASPSLDLGCGDGVFSFIRSGGKFDLKFDAFQGVGNTENFFNKADIFDVFDPSMKPAVRQRGAYRIDYAFDHKENLLKKARTLGLYRNFAVGDANHPLPFRDRSMNSVFSNILYWTETPENTLREIARILRPGGRCCLMLPDRRLAEFSFYNRFFVQTGNKAFSFLDRLDRGRLSSNVKHARSGKEWLNMIEDARLRIVEHRRHLSKTVVQMWDIGLRPLFPILHKMVSSLDAGKMLEIKTEWVETLRFFLEPISKLDQDLTQGEEPAFHCFILEK